MSTIPAVSDDILLIERKRRTTPSGFSEYVRSKGDLFYWAPGKIWIATHYGLAKEILKNPAFSCDRSGFFISRMPNLDLRLIPDFFGVVKKMMVMSDAPEHAKRRGVATRAFTEEIVARYKVTLEKTVAGLLENVRNEDTFDFVQSIGKILPFTVLADLFAIESEDRGDFYRWALNMTQFFGGASQYRNEDGIEVNTSAQGISGYIRKLIETRAQHPGDDFLSLLLEENRTLGLPMEELVAQSVMMIVAGQVTTTDQIHNNLYTLVTQPGLWNLLRRDPSLLPTALEECNRWDPGVTFLFRVAKEPITIDKVSLPEGAVVFISNHAVNRDELYFQNPYAFDPRRSPNPHMAYGFGSHYCLGAPLARVQMLCLFRRLLETYSAVEFFTDHPPVRDHYSLAFSGFKEMKIRVTPAIPKVTPKGSVRTDRTAPSL